MPGTLSVVAGHLKDSYDLAPCLTIGRGKDNLVVLADPKASRHYAMIRYLGDGRYYLMDTGSANGTLLNDRLVLTPSPLHDGDEVRIGSHRLRVHLTAEEASASARDEAEGEDVTVVTMGVPE